MQGGLIMKLNPRTVTKLVSSLMLAGALVALSPTRAEAVLIVYACNDINCAGEVGVLDGSGSDTNGAAGITSASFFGGAIDLTATTKPAVGSAGSPYLNLTYSITAAGFTALGGTPYLYAIESGFSAPGVLNFTADGSNPPVPPTGQATLLGGADPFAFPGNQLFTCVMDCAGSAPAPMAASYYLAIRIQPIPGISGAASGDATVSLTPTTVPDGGSTAALLGSVLVAFGVLRRKLGK